MQSVALHARTRCAGGHGSRGRIDAALGGRCTTVLADPNSVPSVRVIVIVLCFKAELLEKSTRLASGWSVVATGALLRDNEGI